MKKAKQKSMGIQINQLSSGNRNQFIDFLIKNYSEGTRRNFHPFGFSRNELENVFRSIHKDLFYGVFKDNEQMIGFGMLRGWDEGYEIPSLGVLVDERMRGSGIGKHLVEYLVEIAKEHGANRIRLSVYEDNDRAISLYRKNNFKVSEKQDVSGRVKWIMYRDLF